jgi:hypothetical protein
MTTRAMMSISSMMTPALTALTVLTVPTKPTITPRVGIRAAAPPRAMP